MNERINMQDLVDQLAAKHGMNKKEADKFVKEFFLLIEQALESDRCVKIRGFGTFKLVDVESRESVNVNTGERFEIQSHTKISFTPDTALRNTINKPFEHFETVILNENTVLEDTLEEDSEEEPEEEVEVIDASESEAEKAVETDDPVPVADEPVVAVVAQEPFGVKEEEQPLVENTQTEDTRPKPLAEDIIAAELRRAEKEFEGALMVSEKLIDQSEQPSPEKVASNIPVNKPVKEKSATPYLITIIVLVLLLCGSALLLVYYPDLLSTTNQEVADQTAPTSQPVIQPQILPDTLVAVKDTVAEVVSQSDGRASEEVRNASSGSIEAAVKSTANAAIPVRPDSVSYRITGTKVSYTVKEGETLTRISLRFYGTKNLWPYIVQHNRDIIKNPDNVPYGTTLRIPELVRK